MKTHKVVFILFLTMSILLVGCAPSSILPNSEQPDGISSTPANTVDIRKGRTERFEYNNLSLDITNVTSKEIRSGTHDGLDEYQYIVYVLYPGAELIIVNADMVVDGAGVTCSNWFVETTDEFIPITDDMSALEITSDMLSIVSDTYSILVFEFES